MVPWKQRPKISTVKERVRKLDQNNRIRLALRLRALSARVCATEAAASEGISPWRGGPLLRLFFSRRNNYSGRLEKSSA